MQRELRSSVAKRYIEPITPLCSRSRATRTIVPAAHWHKTWTDYNQHPFTAKMGTSEQRELTTRVSRYCTAPIRHRQQAVVLAIGKTGQAIESTAEALSGPVWAPHHESDVSIAFPGHTYTGMSIPAATKMSQALLARAANG